MESARRKLRPGVGRIERDGGVRCGLCGKLEFLDPDAVDLADLGRWRRTKHLGVTHTACFRSYRRGELRG